MSDVLIKGMKMPPNCCECPLTYYEDGTCIFTGIEALSIGIQRDCPLIEVPSPHGRLIDADAYRKEIRDRYESAREWYKGAKTDDIKARAESALFTFTECSLTIRKMPTIIEAEGT